MAAANPIQLRQADVSEFQKAHLPFCLGIKIWLVVSAIFLTAGFATIGYCAATHNIHVWTGIGVGVVGLVGFIPSIRFISSNDSDLKIKIKAGEKIVSHGVTFACLAEEDGFKTFQFSIASFDPEHFKAWLLQKASSRKRAIFERTLLSQVDGLRGQSLSILYHRVTQSCDLSAEKPPEALRIRCTEEWYDFRNENETYIDFANAFTLGGGWRDFGHVQEEVLFEQSFQLALLAYLSDQAKITPAPAKGFPFVVEGVQMQYKIPERYYGEKKLKDVDPHSFVPERFEGGRAVTITGIAATCWTLQGAYYHHDDLNNNFQAIYRACLAEKKLHPANPVVHTGAWGCGAFNNSEKTITLLQMFAAQMAGVSIVFHGVGSPLNPHYTQEFIEGEARRLFQHAQTPDQLFKEILQRQTYPEWRTKQSKLK